MRRWLGLAAKLYPKAWRNRYGKEFDALLDGVAPRWTDVLDILRGAVTMQMKTWSTYLKLVGAVAVAGAVVALVVSFLLPGVYVSSATVRAGDKEDPRTLDRVSHAWQDVTSRSSLSEIIQRPNLDLYKRDRNQKPLEDVIEEMKAKRVKLDVLNDRGETTLRVSFQYPDPRKAQLVVNALTRKLIEAGHMVAQASWAATSANLPEAPVAPNRLAFTSWGLAIGLGIGTVLSLLRRRAKWTMKLAGFGLAGCAAAASLSLLIPNQYTSRAMLRVVPTPKAGRPSRYMQQSEMTDWLKKKETEIFSNYNLAEIIQRRSLDLYPKQREKEPMEAVVATMRQNLGIEAPHSRSAFTISFRYPDRFKAQAVVSALVTKLTDSEFVTTEAELMADPPRPAEKDCLAKTGEDYVFCIAGYPGNTFSAARPTHRRNPAETLELLDPASLPETPVSPNRFQLAAAGFFAGLLLGTYTLRRKPAPNLRPA